MKRNKFTLVGSVILYNPDVDVPENVTSYIDSIDKLFVIDNQGGSDVASKIVALAPNKVTIITNSENEGIAKPLNRVLRLCDEEGFDLLLTMDQDSRFLPNMMSDYRSEVEKFNWEKTFSLGPITVTREEVSRLKCDKIKSQPIQWESVPRMITSGSIISVQKALTLGGFDETLFIDEVDHEICYRATLAGLGLFQSPHILLLHQLGNPTTKFFICRTICAMGHPPVRKYYSARNRVAVWRKFHRQNELYFFKYYIFQLVWDMFKIFYMEDDKLKKAKYFLWGIRDAFCGRMGKRW